MKKAAIIMIILFVNLGLRAQEVLSSGGETQTASGYEVCWTLGEPVIETFMPGTYILTQGFHQSRLTATAITQFLHPGIDLMVFPNPARDFIVIQFNEMDEYPGYCLYDITGKLIEEKSIISASTQLDLQDYQNGQYILQLTSKSGEPLQSVKIVKQ
ncbi:MAG: T9SS type A sorting domain-containing protein [Bacteroidota bacterium]